MSFTELGRGTHALRQSRTMALARDASIAVYMAMSNRKHEDTLRWSHEPIRDYERLWSFLRRSQLEGCNCRLGFIEDFPLSHAQARDRGGLRTRKYVGYDDPRTKVLEAVEEVPSCDSGR